MHTTDQPHGADFPTGEFPTGEFPTGEFPTGDYVRQLRRVADLSQRELADVTRISRSRIERIESGTADPRIGQLGELFGIRGWRLVVIDTDGRQVRPLRELGGDLRDGAGRRYPAHLDVIIDPLPGQWWADGYGLQSPPETFTRNRVARDVRRAQSQWDLKRGPYRAWPNAPRPTPARRGLEAG
jgi:transcriptional regulator with XRE-family HTH domain